MRRGSLLDSFRYALEGVLHVLRTQRHMRFHFLMVVLVLFLAKIYRLERTELLVLFFSICFVLITEMFNTAVEVMIDMITKEFHPLAKQAKDIAAGAVLIASINAVVVGFLLFLDDARISAVLERAYSGSPPPLGHLALIEVVILLIFLVGLKARGQANNEQHSRVSGYTALGFSLATLTIFVTNRELAGVVFVILLAVLLAHSRLERGLSNFRAVFNGAVLGIFLPFLLLKLLP